MRTCFGVLFCGFLAFSPIASAQIVSSIPSWEDSNNDSAKKHDLQTFGTGQYSLLARKDMILPKGHSEFFLAFQKSNADAIELDVTVGNNFWRVEYCKLFTTRTLDEDLRIKANTEFPIISAETKTINDYLFTELRVKSDIVFSVQCKPAFRMRNPSLLTLWDATLTADYYVLIYMKLSPRFTIIKGAMNNNSN